MGAFFLFHRDATVRQEETLKVFSQKGFGDPRICVLGPWTLWHFSKQLGSEKNWASDPEGGAVYAVGTPVYKGLPYLETLGRLLTDFKAGTIDQSALRGNFALLFFLESRLSLLTDQLDLCHVFLDSDRKRFSSSFLAILASFPDRKRLNQLAMLEKLCAGYVVGPDTVVQGIHRLTPEFRREFQADDLTVVPPPPRRLVLEATRQSFAAAIGEQLGILEAYFRDISPLAQACGVDLGLSCGYDSRLLALLARRRFEDFSVHTHWVRGVHDNEKAGAEAIAQRMGVPLRVYPTAPLEKLDTETAEQALLDGLYYFDGRCADGSGAYSQIYTRQYKSLTLGSHKLRLNGEGGEIYRNYYRTCRSQLSFESWMRSRLLYASAEPSLRSEDVRVDLIQNILNKLSNRLGRDLRCPVDLSVTRAYYGEIRIPDCEGVMANADMQLAHFLMPFAEASVLRSAYSLTQHVGIGGRFEGSLIARLDPAIAGLPSHHGKRLTPEPLSLLLKTALIGHAPDSVLRWRNTRTKVWSDDGVRCRAGYLGLRSRSRVVREAEEALRDFVPGFDPDVAVRTGPSKATTVFMGLFLREFAGTLSSN